MVLRVKIFMSIQALPDLRQPMTETVGNEDATTKVEEEGKRNIFQFLFLFFHNYRIGSVNTGEVKPKNVNLFASSLSVSLTFLITVGEGIQKQD